MNRARWLAMAVAALSLGAAPAATAERLYVIDCGWAHAPDQSRWSPGVNQGVPIDVSDNCYLVKHAKGWFLWDTGYPDAVADKPEGVLSPTSGLTAHRSTRLAAELAKLGVKPSDVRFIGISHTHPDHVGNVDLFPTVPVLIQRAEYEWAFGQEKKPFQAEHPATKLDGDKDVFGDGSVVILSTPGHTPGHQSLLVHLARTGWIVLSGDAVHFRSNWDARRVPGINVDKEKTLASMQRLADVLSEHHAQLWINHDKPQSEQLRHAPEAYP
jgi:glyoxylase-like metal-dependent hydrolase (beta-lactamase superfamily II)